MIPYKDLDKHFTAPKRLSPFYPKNVRIPRKLKKKVKAWCGEKSFEGLTNGETLWYYMEKHNNDYKRFLIKRICQQYETEHSTS